MNYLERSQKAKIEILNNNRLIDIARNAFDERIKPFSIGGTVNLYSIGKISDMYVALRIFRTDRTEGKFDLERQMDLMEHYCQNAEYLDASNQLVPRFCIGAIFGNKAAIFTEDLSNGWNQEILHHPDKVYALVGPEQKIVYVDIDWLFRAPSNLEIKYFLNENLIRI